MNVRFEGLHHPFVTCVPDSQCLIVGRTDDKFATRMEDDASHPIVMTNERKETYSGSNVPHTYHLVPRTGCEERSLMCAFIIRSGCRIDRRSRALWRPCDAFHYVLVISKLGLIIHKRFSRYKYFQKI